MNRRNPEYQFVSVDAATLEESMISMYEKLTGLTVMPASPEKLFISWVTSVIVQAYVTMNYIGNQNIPSRAEGDNLDALGELFYAVKRPQAQSAVCVERFSISEAQSVDIVVPIGTRVTDASRTLVWQTTADAIIVAGTTYTDVQLRCQSSGAVGNGYVVGQLNTIVDVYEYYSGCSNITASDGGADRATDEEYYELLKASEDAYSTAGPIGAYAYHAKSVSTQIADVKAIRPMVPVTKTIPVYEHHALLGGGDLDTDTLVVNGGTLGEDYIIHYEDDLLDIILLEGGTLAGNSGIDIEIMRIAPGKVAIYALMKDGTIASDTVKTMILKACNDDTIRPLTDSVSVEDPLQVSYNINLTYYLRNDGTSSAADVAASVQAAVDNYIAWQSGRLGRDINPSKLIALLMDTGIKRVSVVSPAFAVLQDGSNHRTPEIAKINKVTVINGGYEDD